MGHAVNSTAAYQRRVRARTIAAGGPWPCSWCGEGEVWKANARYCGDDCRAAANRAKTLARHHTNGKRRAVPVVAQKTKPPAVVNRRAASLAECG